MLLLCTSTGGVGVAATQLCQTVPDVTIFGTASASKHETIAQGGVTHPIDYRTKDYAEEIRNISPKGEKTLTHRTLIFAIYSISVSFLNIKSFLSLFFCPIQSLFLFCFSAGVDIVLDPLGGSDTQKGFSLLKPLGTLIVFGKTFGKRKTSFNAFVESALMYELLNS